MPTNVYLRALVYLSFAITAAICLAVQCYFSSAAELRNDAILHIIPALFYVPLFGGCAYGFVMDNK